MLKKKKIKFYVGTYPKENHDLFILLKPDNWDDYGFKTSFDGYLFNNGEQIDVLGRVKIAYIGKNDSNNQKDICTTKSLLEGEFDSIDKDYCSLWQHLDAYKKIRKYNVKYNINVFKLLNDLVTKIDYLDSYLEHSVVFESLFRFVSPFTCKNEFFRVSIGREPLVDYNYTFNYPSDDIDSDNSIEFNVKVDSALPTNIHAIIGPNGSGKTYTIKRIIEKNLSLDYRNKEIESILLVSFNPFDDYSEFKQKDSKLDGKKGYFKYIGTRTIDDLNSNKDVDQLTNDFVNNMISIINDSSKIEEWNNFVNEMNSCFNIPEMEYMKIESYLDIFDENNPNDYIGPFEKAFSNMSAGYKEVTSIVMGTIALMAEKSLVLMDEPENHLHPPLLSMLIRWLSKILAERNAFAIISTHSPIILQEIQRKCVWVIERYGSIRKLRRPSIETFGTNLSTLTYEIFGYEIVNSGFRKLLQEISNKCYSFEDALNKYGDGLSDDAKSTLRILCYRKTHQL